MEGEIRSDYGRQVLTYCRILAVYVDHTKLPSSLAVFSFQCTHYFPISSSTGMLLTRRGNKTFQ